MTIGNGAPRPIGNLVLGRRAGRSVYVGRDVTVTVVEISGGNVTLAFEAPQYIAVNRDECGREVHHQFQLAREAGERITEEEAIARARKAREEEPC